MKKVIRITENDIVNIVEKVLVEKDSSRERWYDIIEPVIGGKKHVVKFFTRNGSNEKGDDYRQIGFVVNNDIKNKVVFGSTGKQLHGRVHNPKEYQSKLGIKDPSHYNELVNQITGILHDHLGGDSKTKYKDWKLPQLKV